MPNRRTFLLGTLGAAAVGATSLVTLGIGFVIKNAFNKKPAPAQPASVSPAAAQNSTSPLVLITRDQWGALEPDVAPGRRGENGPYDALTNPTGWLIYDQPLAEALNTIIIHHSALPLRDGPREIQRLHTEEKGFADIGYQFLIGPGGELYEGRALNVRGAHTYGANSGSVGICLIGNFEEIQPTEVQLTVLRALLANLVGQFPRITRLAGHMDFNPGVTLCPGENLYPLLPGLAEERGLRYGL